MAFIVGSNPLSFIFSPSFSFLLRYQEKEQQVKSEDCIPLQLQYLFAKLQSFKDQDYLDTKNLIKSFQWDPEESFKQHDVQVKLSSLEIFL